MNFRIAIPLPVVIVTALYVLLVEVSTLCYLMPGRLGQQPVLFSLQHICKLPDETATSQPFSNCLAMSDTRSIPSHVELIILHTFPAVVVIE